MVVKVPLQKPPAIVPSAEFSPGTTSGLVEKPGLKGNFIELPIVTSEVRQRNYDTVRNGFLDIDSEGRCNAGGICREAFEELRSQCGDPATWTAEDMQKPELHDLVMAYRTFGILHDNKALIPQEKEILEKLFNRQQTINSEKDEKMRSIVSAATLEGGKEKSTAVAANQAQLNEVRRALSEGVHSEDYHEAPLTGGETRSVWAEPGKAMSPELTVAVVKLYELTLKRTDRDRATDRFPEEPVYGPSTPEEADTLLQAILRYLEKIMQKMRNEKTEKTDQ